MSQAESWMNGKMTRTARGPLARRTIGCLIAITALAGLAATPANAEDKTDVQILVIRATNSNTEISPELKSLADSLKKQFKFTGYKVEKKLSHEMKPGETWKTDLAGGFKAELTLKSAKEKEISVDVTVLDKKGEKKVNSPFSIARGKSSLIGGPKLDGDDVLILAISGK